MRYTVDDMAADAAAVLDAVGKQQAHIVGVSMGGMIAQVFAANYPERTLSLTSIMSNTGNPRPAAQPNVALLGRAPARPGDRLRGFIADRRRPQPGDRQPGLSVADGALVDRASGGRG